MLPGQKVKIKEPFNAEFDGIYTIKEVCEIGTYVLLEETEYAFDFKYIEVIE